MGLGFKLSHNLFQGGSCEEIACYRKSSFRYTEAGEERSSVLAVSCEHSISSAEFYRWGNRFRSMDASMVSRMKELEEEGRRLKKMYAVAQLDSDLLNEELAKIVKQPQRWEMAKPLLKLDAPHRRTLG